MTDAAVTAKPAADKAATLHQLTISRLQLGEHARNVWRVVAPEGVTLEDLLAPHFWAHVAHMLGRFDRVEVIGDEEAWYAEFVVRDCGRGFALLHPLVVTRFDGKTQEGVEERGFKVEWKGPHRRWTVVRTADAALLKEGLTSKPEALAWVEDYRKATNA